MTSLTQLIVENEVESFSWCVLIRGANDPIYNVEEAWSELMVVGVHPSMDELGGFSRTSDSPTSTFDGLDHLLALVTPCPRRLSAHRSQGEFG
jgi:hypothetical protein